MTDTKMYPTAPVYVHYQMSVAGRKRVESIRGNYTKATCHSKVYHIRTFEEVALWHIADSMIGTLPRRPSKQLASSHGIYWVLMDGSTCRLRRPYGGSHCERAARTNKKDPPCLMETSELNGEHHFMDKSVSQDIC